MLLAQYITFPSFALGVTGRIRIAHGGEDDQMIGPLLSPRPLDIFTLFSAVDSGLVRARTVRVFLLGLAFYGFGAVAQAVDSAVIHRLRHAGECDLRHHGLLRPAEGVPARPHRLMLPAL